MIYLYLKAKLGEEPKVVTDVQGQESKKKKKKKKKKSGCASCGCKCVDKIY